MALLSGLLFITLGILLVTGVMASWLLLLALVLGGLAGAGVIAIIARILRR